LERRLAAVLAADVVGYTRLMGDDEAGTLQRLTALREEILEPLISQHRGRMVKLMGDGLLIEFASVVDALACAVAWQKRVAEKEADIDDDKRLAFRIGVNIGDMIVEGDDIHGDGVNIAARLEGLAEPGGIRLSGDAYRYAKGKVDSTFEDLGEQKLKNVAEPVRVYRIIGNSETTAQAGRKADELEPAARPSIVVLPFANMSGDQEQEYFSDGITEDITTALSLFRSFPVIARNSAFTYKGKAVRVQEVSQELGVRYILEGSVRRAGKRVRITAQLIDAESGHHVWAERYDRDISDIFDLQDEITQRIATSLLPELTEAEFQHKARRRSENLSVWDLHLRGMAYLYRLTHEDNLRARAVFEKAVNLDPGYAEAWAGLGWSYLRDMEFLEGPERAEVIDRGYQAAVKAVSLDANSAIAQYVLGTAYVWQEDIQRGLQRVEAAIDLNPYFAQAHMALGNRYDLLGRTEEGIAQMQKSLRLSPRDPHRSGYLGYLSRAYISQRQYEQALQAIEEAVNLKPESADLHYRLAIALSHLDRVAEAREALVACDRLQPGFLASRANWLPYADQKRNQAFFAGMTRHGLLLSPGN
jgi:adenylate cyclase